MEFRTPKVLEKKPVIAGFDLKTIVVIAVCLLAALFTVFVSMWLSLSFIVIAGIYVKIQLTFPKKGQLSWLLRYRWSTKCLRIDRPIRSLIKTK